MKTNHLARRCLVLLLTGTLSLSLPSQSLCLEWDQDPSFQEEPALALEAGQEESVWDDQDPSFQESLASPLFEEETGLQAEEEELFGASLSLAEEGDSLFSSTDALTWQEDSLFSDWQEPLFSSEEEELTEAVGTSLEKVSGLKVALNAKKATITLTYNAVENATKYKLSYMKDTQSSYTNVKTKGTSYTFQDLEEGRLYKLRIRAQRGSDVSAYTYRYRYLTQPSLSLTSQEEGFTLSAEAKGGAGEIYYDVYYSENADMSDQVATTLSASSDTSAQLTLSDLKGEQTYYVKVRIYAVYNGKKYLGKASSVKKVTTKAKTEEEEEECFDNSAWLYNSSDQVYYQLGIVYCDQPADESYEKLALFVPEAYMNATDNGDGTYTCTINSSGSVGNYTALTAPIVMPINTPGYSAQAALTSYTSLSAYTQAGFIYAHAGCRGRDAGAPAGVTDLKAAVRYLRYTDSQVPGDGESIFTFGMSGGGAQSSLMGSTGDSSLYDPYLTQIGAKTGVSDAVLGSMCWCPITNLDMADAAYEWMMGCTRSGLSDEDQQVSDLLSSAYASYINSAGLKDGSGNALTLESSDSGIYQAGTYYELMKSTIATSLQNFLTDTSFPYTPSSDSSDGPGGGGPGGGGTPPWQTGDDQVSATTYNTAQEYVDSLNETTQWVSYDSSTGEVTVSSVSSFASLFKSASKSLGAFDQYDASTAENTLFGYGDGNGAHFDSCLAQILQSLGSSYAQSYACFWQSKNALFGTQNALFLISKNFPIYQTIMYFTEILISQCLKIFSRSSSKIFPSHRFGHKNV